MGTTLLADDRNWDHLIHTWTPGIDQLSLGGGILAGFYLAVSLLCFRNVLFLLPRIPGGWAGLLRSGFISLRRADREEGPPVARTGFWWLLLAAALLALGAGRVVNVADLISISARNLMVRHGWYEHRRMVQVEFFGILATAAGCAVTFAFRRDGGILRDLPLRVAGVGTLLCVGILAVRAASFHYSDRLLAMKHLGAWIEAGGLALTAFGAARFRMQAGKLRAPGQR
ncbi:MAG TPA: hypothetical protein VE981_15295 [Planctomycetota bacterium]|nr:hypothetical protein [Planctomycetota bacterium]